jgi:hypothetical protein
MIDLMKRHWWDAFNVIFLAFVWTMVAVRDVGPFWIVMAVLWTVRIIVFDFGLPLRRRHQ